MPSHNWQIFATVVPGQQSEEANSPKKWCGTAYLLAVMLETVMLETGEKHG